MKNNFLNSAAILSGLLSSSLAFAEEAAAASTSGSAAGLVALGAAFVMGVGAFGAASAQGRAASAALEGIARNPTSRGEVFVPLIIVFAFMEFQALLCFIVALMLLK
jgi:F-type H+-transporting ATPase subunit c